MIRISVLFGMFWVCWGGNGQAWSCATCLLAHIAFQNFAAQYPISRSVCWHKPYANLIETGWFRGTPSPAFRPAWIIVSPPSARLISSLCKTFWRGAPNIKAGSILFVALMTKKDSFKPQGRLARSPTKGQAKPRSSGIRHSKLCPIAALAPFSLIP